MASGFEELVFNTRERVVSVDHNRAQKFKGKDLAELLRNLLNVYAGTDDTDSAGLGDFGNLFTPGNPLSAEVIQGLLVKPQVGSLALLVDIGTAMIVNPDLAPDDSSYKYVNDFGVSVVGALVMTANASGSVRFDVVECQPADTVIETDNRDIFDPTSGLFTVTNVTKARANRLTYRVRLGTPGAGFPGTVAGWLPLAVACVPNGATNNDVMTFWDVRPLINDRAYGPFNVGQDLPKADRGTLGNQLGTGQLAGVAEYVFAGRRIGGRLRRGTPDNNTVQRQFVDVTDVTNQEPGFSFSNGALYYVYLVLPFFLPRWAKYSNQADQPGIPQRVPQSPRGIVVVSNRPPAHMYGVSTAPIQLPAPWPVGQTALGLCIDAGIGNGAGPGIATIERVRTLPDVTANIVAGTTILGGAASQFVLSEDTHYPRNARALILHFGLHVSVPVNGNVYTSAALGACVVVTDTLGKESRTVVGSVSAGNFTGGAVVADLVVAARVSVPDNYPTPAAVSPITVTWLHNLQCIPSTPLTFTADVRVVGWETTP